jgi:hypothetical protein
MAKDIDTPRTNHIVETRIRDLREKVLLMKLRIEQLRVHGIDAGPSEQLLKMYSTDLRIYEHLFNKTGIELEQDR